jgi:hypothetical protein
MYEFSAQLKVTFGTGRNDIANRVLPLNVCSYYSYIIVLKIRIIYALWWTGTYDLSLLVEIFLFLLIFRVYSHYSKHFLKLKCIVVQYDSSSGVFSCESVIQLYEI